jgi:rhodanese-related sulfurtransferase
VAEQGAHAGTAVRAVTALLTLAAALAAAPAAAVPASATQVPRYSATEALLAARRGDILLVDVRPAGQRALGHVRDDVHVPIDQLATRLPGLPRDRRLVFYCACVAEELALEAAQAALQAGCAQVGVLVGGYDAWRTAGGPVQAEASWEEIFRVEDAPSGWGKTPVDSSRCRYARDTTVAYRGSASGRIGCVADSAARGLAGLSQRMDAGVLEDRAVTLSAMVKVEGVTGGAFLWVGAENSEGMTTVTSKAEQDPMRGTADWRLVQVSGVVPAGAVKALFGISLRGPGRVWIDDVRLVADPEAGLPRIRAVVENAGFEE